MWSAAPTGTRMAVVPRALRRAWQDPDVWKALLSELAGVALLTVLGASVEFRPFETAAAYTALVYSSKFISGGHLNPLVSLSAAFAGHVHWSRAVLYVAAQAAGAVLGSVLEPLLVPGVRIGHFSPACLSPPSVLPSGMDGLNHVQLFLWEALLSVFFVSVVYVTLLMRRSETGPLAAGVALYACMATGGQYTGGSPLNPAISMASTLVFDCYWTHMWVYVLSELSAVVMAGSWAVAWFGRGPHITGDRPTESLGEALLAGDAPVAEEGLPLGRDDRLTSSMA